MVLVLSATKTADAPAAIGPYSQAIASGNLLFTSGQIPLDPATGEMVGNNITEQTKQVMENLSALLSANGIGFDRVIKASCFLADMADFAAFNEVYAQYFNIEPQPARVCVAARALPKGALCEVDVIAELG